jgi:hypothetical protein
VARPINATLFVNSFTATGNPGEYTFDSAFFNNQTDATGNGAGDATVGSVLYIPASDVNTGLLVAGVVHRYRITQLVIVDPQTLSGTILWDEKAGPEVDAPSNGAYCLYSEATTNNRFGLPPSETVYPELSAGSTIGALNLDIRDISDEFSQVGGGSQSLYFVGTTSDATPLVLAPKTSLATIPNNSSAIYKISVMGRRTDVPGEGCAFQFVGMLNRNSNSLSTALIGSPQKTIVARSDVLWDAEILADTTNGGVSVQIAGSASAQIEWTASVDLVKSTT